MGFYRFPQYDETDAGRKWGDWEQIGPSFKVKIDKPRRDRYAVCRCSCGTVKVVLVAGLKNGSNARCNSCCRRKINTKHGLSRTTEYRSWTAMIHRCTTDPSRKQHKYFKYYGGRGIKVCERWLNSFEDFLRDMGPKPTPRHQLDRFPNRNGNYEPGNVRWATPSENIRNRDYTTANPRTIYVANAAACHAASLPNGT